MSARLRWYVLGLSVSAIWLFLLLRQLGVGEQRHVSPLLLLLLGGLAVAAYQFPVVMGPDRTAHVAGSPLLVGALLFPADHAMALAVIASLAGTLLARLRWRGSEPRQRLYPDCLLESTQMGLAIGAAAGFYHLIDPRTPLLNPDTLPAVAAIVLAAGLAYAVNVAVAALGLTCRQGGRPIRWWLDGARHEWREDMGLALLALLTALLVDDYPWAVLLQAGCIGIVHLSLKRTSQLLRQTRSTVERLAQVVDARDPYTAMHSSQVSRYAVRLAQRVGLSAAQIEVIETAGMVHDVGKIAVRDAILLKPGRLTEDEFAEMKRHAEVGAEMVGALEEYQAGRLLILHHHEAWDGSGYPHGLAGEEIPLGARIMAVADSYDAMTTDRPYRQALPLEVVIEQFRRGRGKQWDPYLTDLWLHELELELALKAARRVEAVTPARVPLALQRAS